MDRQEVDIRLIRTHDQRPRIFISSSLEDLRAERNAAKQAILDIKLVPIMFECGAHPYPPRAWYTASLEQSHLYVGIFGDSYGQLVPGMDISGLEDEFNLAAEKPRLVYVRKSSEGRDPRLERLLQRIREEAAIAYFPFSSSDELAERIKDDVIQHLSEAYLLNIEPAPSGYPPFSYLGKLQEEMNARGLLRRVNLVTTIQAQLELHRILEVVGEPGIGKTYLLGTLGLELDAIYVPLRHKSTQQVCSYLANQLSVRRGRLPRRLLTEDEARDQLQRELAIYPGLLLIDEADQNPTTVEALLGMELHGARAVFASRGRQPGLFQGVPTFEVPGLTNEEIDQFLGLHDVLLPPGENERLREASRGNPLYLFYFTQQPLSPFPDGLAQYERAIWGQLSAVQKEAFSLIATSFAPLTVSDIHELLSDTTHQLRSPMETQQLIDSAGSLLRQLEGHLEIFHPHFEEHVRTELEATRLAVHYHRILGEYASKKRWIISTAFHFVRADDPRARRYLPQASSGAFMRGSWPLAEEFLRKRLDLAVDEHDKRAEAHARYELSSLYSEMGRFKEARQEINGALHLLSGLSSDDIPDHEEFADAVRLWSTLLRVQEGAAEEVIEALDNAARAYRGKDPLMEAWVNVNLAYACIQLSRFREGADAAQRALDLSTQLDDQQGIYCSLTNLAACVGELGEDDRRERLARRLIDLGSANALPRIEAAGLSHLGVVQRRASDYRGAERSFRRAIRIAQQLGALEIEIMNISNLGNVYRDRHLPQLAEDAYREALAKAQEYDLPREEGRVLELLSRSSYEDGRYQDAAGLGGQALSLHKRFGNNFRMASTLDYVGRSYAKLRQHRQAAETYESSASYYERCESWKDAASMFQRAAGLWSFLENAQRAFHCTAQGVRCAIASSDPQLAERLLPGVKGARTGRLGQLYLQALRPFLQSKAPPSFNGLIRNICVYCKRHDDPNERQYLKAGLQEMVAQLSAAAPRALSNAIAVGVEQAGPLLSPDELDDLAERAAERSAHVHYRALPDGVRVWTVGLDWEQPIIAQIISLADDPLPQRIAMALALIIHANSGLIEKTISELGGSREEGISLYVATQRDVDAHGDFGVVSYSSDRESLPASVSTTNVPWDQPQPPTVLVLHEDYELASDWAQNPENKALVWVLMNVFRALATHATHTSAADHPALAQRSREFCEVVLL
jgi:tetratricopeptide (TPR) repeat protein